MTKTAKVRFHTADRRLVRFADDLRDGLSDEAALLDLNVYLGLHDQTVPGGGSRINVGIQTESLIGSDCEGRGVDHAKLVRNAENCDVILDFSYDSIQFYKDLPGFDFGRLVVGPYFFPSRPVAVAKPDDPQILLLEDPEKGSEREGKAAVHGDRLRIRDSAEGSSDSLNMSVRSAQGLLHLGHGPESASDFAILLKAYMNGNVMIADKCPKPFLAGRHCLSASTPITDEARQAVVTHLSQDFGTYTLSRVLLWAAAGRPTLPEVNYLGAYDRYNYGDLLMPILLDRYRRKHFPNAESTTRFHFTSLRDSDLRHVGGIPTRAAYQDDGLVARDGAIIVCGGEVVGTRRKLLLSHYGPGTVETDRNVPEFPFLPAPDAARRVLLNSVGGRTNAQTAGRVGGTRYASYRDRRMEPLARQNRGRMMICPDSVTLMSRMIPLDALRSLCRPEILARLPDRFICYQAAPGHVTDSPEQIATVLRGHCDASEMGCVLLTIGYAEGHDDSVHLRGVAAHDPGFVLMDDLNIYEIAYTIATSEIFAGTSLHGTITSMSYGTAFVPLHESVVKLRQYVRTWAPDSFLRRDRLSQMRTWLDAPQADRTAALARLSEQVERMMDLVEVNNYIIFREALFDM